MPNVRNAVPDRLTAPPAHQSSENPRSENPRSENPRGERQVQTCRSPHFFAPAAIVAGGL